MDIHEKPYILPLASTLGRALSLVIEDEIRASRDHTWRDEPFPYVMAERIARDTRLMELIEAGAFATIDGGSEDLREWCELLVEIRSASMA